MKGSKTLFHSVIFAQLFDELESALEGNSLKGICSRVGDNNVAALKTFLLNLGGSYSEPEKSGKDGVFFEWILPPNAKLFLLGSETHFHFYLFRDQHGDIIFSLRDGSGEVGEHAIPESIISLWRDKIGYFSNHFQHVEGFLCFKDKK